MKEILLPLQYSFHLSQLFPKITHKICHLLIPYEYETVKKTTKDNKKLRLKPKCH